MNDLVNADLVPVKLNTGKATWLECRASGRVKSIEESTHGFAIPDLMPATVIFVHGVNSEGEWRRDAARQFSSGLNTRLGREDLVELPTDPDRSHRLLHTVNGKRFRAPIIPFYWGYSVPEKQRRKLVDDPKKFDTKDTRHSEVWRDTYGNPLRKDGTWGGGPFQNGSGSLTSCWFPEGFRVKVLAYTLKIDVNKLNPVLGRQLVDCPDLFDTLLTDWLSAAGGFSDMQTLLHKGKQAVGRPCNRRSLRGAVSLRRRPLAPIAPHPNTKE
ncbi:hypothetical protein H7F36_14355 [Variovorax sp. PAMC28562]|uniref:T6SS effector phospholipase Tle3 domain-containing protein n=1 Tax=Variovorax sp. PAMC28562 TaxID=2762323 RepID=UPI00164E4D7D|nr:hypothetical protein [Variovorax sp. PAMC28562]QNK72399.1 hypothetical protein H7F36_14355 [Variovorax sp. PAMC28562]